MKHENGNGPGDPPAEKAGRAYGLDLFKTASMGMIVLAHVLAHGGILERVDPYSIKGGAVWFLEAALYGSANNYALVSGYVGYGKPFRPANLFYLYCQALFYRVAVTALFLRFRPDAVEGEAILNALVPMRFGHWYFTAYFSMFFCIPLLDRIVREFDRKFLEKLLAALFLTCSLLPTLLHADTAHTNYGYSALWLGILYLTGACLKKYAVAERVRKRECLAAYLLCVGASWGAGLLAGKASQRLLGTSQGLNVLLQFTSPTVLCCALSMTLLFAKLRPGAATRRFAGFFAPLSFGVYLLHTEPLLWNTFFARAFAAYAELPLYGLLAAALGTALGIWLLCSLVDWLRLSLFRLLRVRECCGRLELLLRRWLNRHFPELWG